MLMFVFFQTFDESYLLHAFTIDQTVSAWNLCDTDEWDLRWFLFSVNLLSFYVLVKRQSLAATEKKQFLMNDVQGCHSTIMIRTRIIVRKFSLHAAKHITFIFRNQTLQKAFDLHNLLPLIIHHHHLILHLNFWSLRRFLFGFDCEQMKKWKTQPVTWMT